MTQPGLVQWAFLLREDLVSANRPVACRYDWPTSGLFHRGLDEL